jgi:hypothetical protein
LGASAATERTWGSPCPKRALERANHVFPQPDELLLFVGVYDRAWPVPDRRPAAVAEVRLDSKRNRMLPDCTCSTFRSSAHSN